MVPKAKSCRNVPRGGISLRPREQSVSVWVKVREFREGEFEGMDCGCPLDPSFCRRRNESIRHRNNLHSLCSKTALTKQSRTMMIWKERSRKGGVRNVYKKLVYLQCRAHSPPEILHVVLRKSPSSLDLTSLATHNPCHLQQTLRHSLPIGPIGLKAADAVKKGDNLLAWRALVIATGALPA